MRKKKKFNEDEVQIKEIKYTINTTDEMPAGTTNSDTDDKEPDDPFNIDLTAPHREDEIIPKIKTYTETTKEKEENNKKLSDDKKEKKEKKEKKKKKTDPDKKKKKKASQREKGNRP